jgi:hypothetical protein
MCANTSRQVRLACVTLRRMWFPPDEPWQYRVLDAMPPSIDLAQLARAREMSLTERIEAMCALVRAGEELRRGLVRKENL